MLYPLTFESIPKERVWGGRKLEQLYHKRLPPAVPIGESWEISDRPGDVSVISNGPLRGKDLHTVVERHGQELLGPAFRGAQRFPLLIKILDAREKLSLQVHPPAAKAAQLGGEPKTEMWYIAEAEPEAELYVGLRRGVSRQEFEEKVKSGTVADCFHRIKVRARDAMFLPSGRVHAIGGGLVIFEIQQNSDTTYRVFDWNRAGLDGKSRPLHERESLASIDFEDFEPGLVDTSFVSDQGAKTRSLVVDSLFRVQEWELAPAAIRQAPEGSMEIIGLLKGSLKVTHGNNLVKLSPGDFCVIPASAKSVALEAEQASIFLTIQAGSQAG